MEIREKIVELAKSGLKPCQISKELRVSHGCVSKLLTKWRKTGTVKPEKIGGSRPKKVLPSVARAITVYKHYRPRLQSWQIKEYLIKDGVCTDGNVPSISSINKLDYIYIPVSLIEIINRTDVAEKLN
uniref:Paired domain-containing protein n=1 Tax=Romanomermis culicivorax TaxID=13658 RepID=A0A915IBJ7_ROMCU